MAQWRPTWRPRPTQTYPTPPPAQATPTATYVAPPPNAAGTQTLYGQCGGQEWNGPYICPSGAACKSGNQWYSQCVAVTGAGGPANPPPSATDLVTRTLTTIFSVGGPTPTVISTRITYLTPRPSSTATSFTTVTLVPDEPCDQDWCS
ncbi:hypothetical protein B0T19DRAFT_459910 [Cercophora scortea]|uniref:CBM1 domain-containing protein n=1 Tax=Cercophora scortea TaxID=314031 RepID=A0AAE0MCA3_9PEZI|nr:hypothetical protein B0T19DRAFT_459910 [Cercophora scortea]